MAGSVVSLKELHDHIHMVDDIDAMIRVLEHHRRELDKQHETNMQLQHRVIECETKCRNRNPSDRVSKEINNLKSELDEFTLYYQEAQILIDQCLQDLEAR